jgi:hypothetical protein
MGIDNLMLHEDEDIALDVGRLDIGGGSIHYNAYRCKVFTQVSRYNPIPSLRLLSRKVRSSHRVCEAL